ncbi:nucleoside diphosphate kinase 6 [Ochlerotatus camptorhynchus]|uniref:nucleoside diphosphate kinase 6 n=1 Tax=Ochlerotatus camptorhynchus TaxID=644619 RepID=UPI0031D37BF5
MSGSAFTLAIFKPHLLKNPVAYGAVERLIESSGIRIVTRKQVRLTQPEAERFYQDHRGKFFYQRLISLMTSGPLEVLVLSGENVITRWRELMGPTKVFKAVYSQPECIRSLYGLTDTRNASHGSDSVSSFLTEAALFFPNQEFPTDNCESNSNQQNRQNTS